MLWLYCSHSERRLIKKRGWTSNPFPLENLSPITDKHLLRPRRQNFRSMAMSSPQAPKRPQKDFPNKLLSSSKPAVHQSQRALPSWGTHEPTVSLSPHGDLMARPGVTAPRSFISYTLGDNSIYHPTLTKQQHDEISRALHCHLSGGSVQFWAPSSLMPVTLCDANLTDSRSLPMSITKHQVSTPCDAFYGPSVLNQPYYASPLSSHPCLDEAPSNGYWNTSSEDQPHVVVACNLSCNMTPDAIRSMFSEVDTVEHCEIDVSQASNRNWHAIIKFWTAAHARAAVERVNRTGYQGSRIQVSLVHDGAALGEGYSAWHERHLIECGSCGGKRDMSGNGVMVNTGRCDGPVIADGAADELEIDFTE